MIYREQDQSWGFMALGTSVVAILRRGLSGSLWSIPLVCVVALEWWYYCLPWRSLLQGCWVWSLSCSCLLHWSRSISSGVFLCSVFSYLWFILLFAVSKRQRVSEPKEKGVIFFGRERLGALVHFGINVWVGVWMDKSKIKTMSDSDDDYEFPPLQLTKYTCSEVSVVSFYVVWSRNKYQWQNILGLHFSEFFLPLFSFFIYLLFNESQYL
jgi:hypothetical protein